MRREENWDDFIERELAELQKDDRTEMFCEECRRSYYWHALRDHPYCPYCHPEGVEGGMEAIMENYERGR